MIGRCVVCGKEDGAPDRALSVCDVTTGKAFPAVMSNGRFTLSDGAIAGACASHSHDETLTAIRLTALRGTDDA